MRLISRWTVAGLGTDLEPVQVAANETTTLQRRLAQEADAHHLLLGPIFVPLAATIGLDPVQRGLIMILNLGIGLYTPPIGTTLFISSSIAGSSLSQTTRALWPFFGVAIALLLALSYIPALTLY